MVEPALPEAGHLAGPVDQGRECAELRAVMRKAAFMAVAHQPGLLQNSQMFRDRGLRNFGPRRERAHRLFPLAAQALEKCPSRRIGQRSEKSIVRVGHSTTNNYVVID